MKTLTDNSRMHASYDWCVWLIRELARSACQGQRPALRGSAQSLTGPANKEQKNKRIMAGPVKEIEMQAAYRSQ